MYKIIEKLCEQKEITVYKLCKELKISSSTFTELKSGRTKELSAKNVSKVADYFGVTVDFLLGKEPEAYTIAKQPITENDIKVALFGGDDENADKKFEDVKRYIEFLNSKKD